MNKKKNGEFAKILTKNAVLCALSILLAAIILTSCGENAGIEPDDKTSEDAAAEETASQYSLSAPAWASEINMKKEGADSGESSGGFVEAVSTMYVDSTEDGFGAVTEITVTAEQNDGVPYDIYSYKDSKEKILYLFLPCTADLSSVTVKTLHSNGCESGYYTLDFTAKEYGVKGGDAYYSVIAMQSEIPSLFIQIDESEGTIRSMNSDSSHSTYSYGDMTLLVADSLAKARGWKTEYTSVEFDKNTPGTMEMRGRGNWTWNQTKKPYQISLEKKIDLLGMGKAKNYILLANVMDASLLRNQLFYDLADAMGLAYTPDIEPVDVFMNGEYIGSYSLAEKIEVGENRVDIDDNRDFLLELDHYYMNEVYTFTTKKGKNFTMHNREDYKSLAEIEKIMNEIEKYVYDEDSDDYMDYIDVESWVKYWWLQDLSRNNDTFIGSNFFYYVSNEGKLYAGPVWDMDNTLGIWGGGENLLSKGWHSDDRGWLGHLYKNDSFNDALVDYYVRGGLREIFFSLPDKIDEYAAYVYKSAEMNYIVNQKQYFVNCGCETYEDDIEYLKEFLSERLTWYDKKIG